MTIKNVICDIDGVLMHDNVAVPGAAEFLHGIMDKGLPLVLLTNYPSQTGQDLANRFATAGVDVPDSVFYTSAMATADFLRRQEGKKAYVVGEGALIHELYKAGFTITDVNPDFVIVGETRSYNWDMMHKAAYFVANVALGDSISFVVEAYGEIDRYEDNYYFYESSLLVHVDSNNCIDEIEIRNDEEHSHVVMLNGTNIFSEMKDVVIELIVRLNQSPVEDELGTYEAKRIGLAYSFSMTDEKIEEMISEAKEEGTYEEMKEEIEADIKRAKYLQTISIRKTK